MNFRRSHHRDIAAILKALDNTFLSENRILFGGGTRIALELDEFRESLDIDLFCVGKAAYRAARSTVSNEDFGKLFKPGQAPERYQGRDIRIDRDAIRSFLAADGGPIKLEIIHFDDQNIKACEPDSRFPIPYVCRESCFATKLLANADRYRDSSKDIVDLCMMKKHWGAPLPAAWESAFSHYGRDTVTRGLERALMGLVAKPAKSIAGLVSALSIDENLAEEIVK